VPQEPKSQRERAADLVSLLVPEPDQRPTLQQVLWTIRIVLVIVVLLGILTLIGLPFGITLWSWVKLLIIPGVLVIGGYLFTRSENRATQAASERRAQAEALQAYLDQIGQLLLDKEQPLRQSKEGDEVRTLARARTLTVITRLDRFGRGSAVQFLYESGLIRKDNPIIDLKGADLRETYLQGANLREAYLQEVYLDGAHLLGANLRGADLQWTWLSEANLAGAALQGADLRWALLEEANLFRADLSGADLRETFGGTVDQLSAARSLKGATMPDGQTLRDDETPNGPTFADWYKNRVRRKEYRENE